MKLLVSDARLNQIYRGLLHKDTDDLLTDRKTLLEAVRQLRDVVKQYLDAESAAERYDDLHKTAVAALEATDAE